jgi:hypothetical protein
MKRIVAGAVGLVVALAAAACGSQCPEAADPNAPSRVAVKTPECANRVASDVCSWSAEDHANNRRAWEGLERDNARLKARDGSYIDIVLRDICGCQVSPEGPCFFTTLFTPDGHYLITTGSPGCDTDPDVSARAQSAGVDAGRCGSIAKIGPSVAAVAP